MKKINYKICTICIICGLFLFISFFIGCYRGTYGIEIVIENQTDQILTIYSGTAIHENGNIKDIKWSTTPLGTLVPGGQISSYELEDSGSYPFKATDDKENIVFSEVFKYKNMIEIGKKIYKIVIPPLIKAPEISNNITLNK